MARELVAAAGPELNHLNSWHFGTGSGTGWSIATTPAPTHGTYIFKGVSGSTNSLALSRQTAFTPKTYVWLSVRGFRLTGTLASGNDRTFLNLVGGATLNLHWLYESASTFKIQLKRSATSVLISANAFNVDQWYEIRVEFDGTNWTLWVDGTEEGEGANTDQPADTRIILQKSILSAGQEMYYRGVLLTHSNSESDRPGTAVEVDRLDPTGNTAESDAGDPSDCTTNGDFSGWDDYAAGGAPDDDTDFNCFDSAAERKEVSSLNSHTPTDNIEGIIYHLWGRGAAAAKTGNTHARIKEGANASEVALSNFSLDTFVPKVAVFDLAPDAGAWTQGDVDALEAGLRSEAANDVNVRASALAVELISVDDDPPAFTLQAGAGVALGSSNMGII